MMRPSPCVATPSMFERTRRFFGRRKDNAVAGTKNLLNAKEISSHASLIKTMLRSLTHRPDQVRQESFANAYLRLGLSEDSLQQVHRQYSWRFYIFLTFGLVALSMGAYSALDRSWMDVAQAASFLVFCLSFAATASFRLLQIEKRELTDFWQWLGTPGSWIPAPFERRSPPATTSRATSVTVRPLPGRRP